MTDSAADSSAGDRMVMRQMPTHGTDRRTLETACGLCAWGHRA